MWCPSRKTQPAGYSFANQTELPYGNSVFYLLKGYGQPPAGDWGNNVILYF